MKRPLKVGDICIGQNAVWYSKWNGTEITIVEKVGDYFRVDLPHPDGGFFYCLSHQLRLKPKPPADDCAFWAASKVKDLFKENDLVTA